MIAALLLIAASAQSAAQPVDGEVEAEYRRNITTTCPQVLMLGHGFFKDEARLSAHGLYLSPTFKKMAALSFNPMGAYGQKTLIIYNDNAGMSYTKVMCMVSGRPGIDVAAHRESFFYSLSPSPKQIKDFKREAFVDFARPEADGVKAHTIVFWRQGVFLKPFEESRSR